MTKVFISGPGLAGKRSTTAQLGRQLRPHFEPHTPYGARDGWECALPSGRKLCVRMQLATAYFYDMVAPDPSVFEVLPANTIHAEAQFFASADVLLFVLDSQRVRSEANLEHIDRRKQHLRHFGRDPDDVPAVFFFNKQDLPDTMPREELAALVPWSPHTAFAAGSAVTGRGVDHVLSSLAKLVAV